MQRRRFRFLSLALVAMLSLALLAACSDDDGDGDTPDLPEPTSTAGMETPGGDETPDDAETPDDSETPDDGTPGGGGGGSALSLTMADISFDPTELSAPAGEEVTLELTNNGALEHDFSIDEIPVEYSLSGDAEDGDDWDLHASLPAGTSGSITMTVSEPGEYTFYCSVPGHREAGMEGTFTVE